MKKTILAAVVACAAAISFSQPAAADSLTIKIKPGTPVIKKVIIKQPCYTKTTKKIYNNKVVIKKVRVCP